MALLHTWNAAELIPMYDGVPHPQINIKLVASATYPAGQVIGETATAGTFGIYVGGSATDPAKGVLKYSCTTDASGNITVGAGAAGNEFGIEQLTTPMYVGGAFKTTELTGLDAGAVVDLGGHFISGTITDGVLSF